jgi:hypothetical protein
MHHLARPTLGRRTALALATLAIAFIGPITVAGPASAAGPVVRVQAKVFSVPTGAVGGATVMCPGDRRALGGGVVQVGEADGLSVMASGPLDATGKPAKTLSGDVPKGWLARIKNTSGSTRQLKVFAMCAGGTNARITAVTVAMAPGGSNADPVVRCPDGRRAVGGGAVPLSVSEGYLEVRVSGPLDATGITLESNDGDVPRIWYTAMRNGDSSTRKVRLSAICMSSSTATLDETTHTIGGETRDVIAICPEGKRLIGGGIVQSGPAPELYLPANGPLDGTGFTVETRSGDIPRQWYTSILNALPETRTFRTFAICS